MIAEEERAHRDAEDEMTGARPADAVSSAERHGAWAAR